MEEKESSGRGIWIAVAVLLLIYVFCPFVIALPLLAAKRAGLVSQNILNKVEIIFVPLDELRHAVPAYKQLLDVERDMLNKLIGFEP